MSFWIKIIYRIASFLGIVKDVDVDPVNGTDELPLFSEAKKYGLLIGPASYNLK